jgi:hypothetical protein
MSEWPTLQPYPHGTPSDAELEAARDVDHLRAVAAWFGADHLWTGITAGAVL